MSEQDNARKLEDEVRRLRERIESLEFACVIFEATWFTGGYQEPEECWRNGWPHVELHIAPEHNNLTWAVTHKG